MEDQNGSDSHQWPVVLVLSAVLALEIALVYCFCGDLVLSMSEQLLHALETTRVKDRNLNRWALTAVAVLLVGSAWLRTHLQRHFAEYREVRISSSLFAWQLVVSMGVVAYARVLSASGLRLILGAAGEWVLSGGVAIIWMLSTIATVVPRRHLGELIKWGTASVVVGTALAWIAWKAGLMTEAFWNFTGGTTLDLVYCLLHAVSDSPVIQPDEMVVGTRDFQVRVYPLCSGFQGIGLICVLLAAYLWLYRRSYRFPRSFLLFPVGITLIWLANAVRITALILVGVWISPELAVDGFHSKAGWIAFLIVGLGIVWASSRMRFFTVSEAFQAAVATVPVAHLSAVPQMAESSTTPIDLSLAPSSTLECVLSSDYESCESATSPQAVMLLVPFLVLTATTILTGAFTSGFDVLYPIRVIVVAVLLWYFRGEFLPLQCRVSARSILIGAVAFALWMLLVPAGTEQSPEVSATRDPMSLSQPWSILWLMCRVLGSVVTVPIAEELAFRGFLTRRIISEDVDSVNMGQFSWLSFLLSSVAFGALHGDAWLAATVVGMLFAVALYSRRRLVDAVLAHATTNACLSVYVMATGSWSAWG